MRLVAAIALAMLIAPVARSYTPIPAQKAACIPYQVCQTCYRQDGSAYTCNCHLECTPGIH